ncbi:MAG: PD-(D/E)XK nuclease family protein [Chloroflexi bacterium]|nr:PD-(D/E)XK nuclease family protein [Chloroflexota bacterium]
MRLPAAYVRASLSPSRAADFKACPLLYRFRTIDRLPEPASRAATRGTVVHAVLERLFDVPPEERTLSRARDLVEPVWQELLERAPELARLFPHELRPASLPAAHGQLALEFPTRREAELASSPPDSTGNVQPVSAADGRETEAEPNQTAETPGVSSSLAPPTKRDDVLDTGSFAAWLESARDLVGNYFVLEDPTRLAPAAREELVEVVVDGLRLRGYVDRLDVSADGDIRIVDYKTGSIPRETFEAKALFQMKFYALVLWRTRGVVPRQLKLVYLADRDTLTYSPHADELARFERTLHAIWTAITRAAESGEFRPSPGPLCDWCSHRAICPAFGGTPPPLPSNAADTICADPTDERPLVLAEP